MIDYSNIYHCAQIRDDKLMLVGNRAGRIMKYQGIYKTVQLSTQIPWYCIALIHSLECSLDFDCHLHNGDSLNGRTVHIPKGRPVADPISGKLPYSWQESASDALSNAWHPQEWGVSGCLEFLERYNGLGYRNHGINSPYLWSMTDQYRSGLFVSDGQFDKDIVSRDIGAAALLKKLETYGVVKFTY